MKKIDHIGIAVKNLEQSNQLFTTLLGKAPHKTEVIEKQKVKVSFFKLDNVKIELLEATHPESPIARFIEKRGEGVHHLAFAVDDVTQNLKKQQDNGFSLIGDGPRSGADNKLVGFLHPKTTNGVLVELCQKEH